MLRPSLISDSSQPHELQHSRLSVHGILQAGIFEWVVLGVSTGDPTHDKVMRRDLTGKESQVSRGPLSEHLPETKICLLTVCYTIPF